MRRVRRSRGPVVGMPDWCRPRPPLIYLPLTPREVREPRPHRACRPRCPTSTAGAPLQSGPRGLVLTLGSSTDHLAAVLGVPECVHRRVEVLPVGAEDVDDVVHPRTHHAGSLTVQVTNLGLIHADVTRLPERARVFAYALRGTEVQLDSNVAHTRRTQNEHGGVIHQISLVPLLTWRARILVRALLKNTRTYSRLFGVYYIIILTIFQ